jgi:hypothetical protein
VELEERSFSLSGLDRAGEALELSNVGAGEIEVELVSFNGHAVFHTRDDVWAEIESLAPDPFDDSLATRIFRFVDDNHAHADPLTSRFGWLLAPPHFFNSAGLGMCGQASDLMAGLAGERGIPARVWAVNEHVVSELFVGGAWRMYDADYGVYFGDRARGIASVAQLEADGTLMTEPEWRMETRFDPYTSYYAGLFTSGADNHVRPTSESTLLVPRVRFRLPPGGSLRFPGRFAPPPPDRNGAPTVSHGDLALRWPPGATGPLTNGLILHTLRGAGTLELAGRRYSVGSASLQTIIDQRTSSLDTLRVRESSEPLEVLYLVNPLRWQVEAENELVLRATPAAELALAAGPGQSPDDDLDADGIPDAEDGCPRSADPLQRDADTDGAGNACDADFDQSGRPDSADLEALRACRIGGAPPASDPACTESDLDGDGTVDADDELRWTAIAGYVPSTTSGCGIGGELVPALIALQAAFAAARRRTAP